jgi:hypothetical protein
VLEKDKENYLGDCVINEEELHTVKKERNILGKVEKGRLIGFATSRVGTLFKAPY